MARVDFYILPEHDGDRRKFACALTQKAWKSGNRVCLFAGDRQRAGELDDLLWTFRDISFVPHALADSSDLAGVPVIIDWNGNDRERGNAINADVLINLADEIPAVTARFDRIAEIVGGDAGEREAARERYRHYRSQGHELHDHALENP